MKLSTIFKAVTVVSTIATVGLFAYSKAREAKKIKMDNDIEDVVEPKESEEAHSDLSDFTTKEKNAAILGGTLCGLTGGLIVYATLVPICRRIGDCLIVYKLVQKATGNGNLTIEELIDLAYNRSQEVA